MALIVGATYVVGSSIPRRRSRGSVLRPPPLPRRPPPPACARDRLAAVQPAEVGPRPHAERECPLLVEAAEPLVLHQRVAVRAHAMVGLERRYPVAVAAQLLVRLELD